MRGGNDLGDTWGKQRGRETRETQGQGQTGVREHAGETQRKAELWQRPGKKEAWETWGLGERDQKGGGGREAVGRDMRVRETQADKDPEGARKMGTRQSKSRWTAVAEPPATQTPGRIQRSPPPPGLPGCRNPTPS